uniref:BED-type domain-containing protein n=1 Tax=Salix viminalis TaxID=40686 RepID=A0A6N2LGG6_SALVM
MNFEYIERRSIDPSLRPEMENQNVSSIDTTPTSTTAGSGSVTNDRGKQPEVLILGKRNVDDRKKSQIWRHFTKLDGDPSKPRAACNYCRRHYACHTILNGTSNMWSHLKGCKKFPFVVDKKQKLLVLEPKKDSDESADKNMGTLKAIVTLKFSGSLHVTSNSFFNELIYMHSNLSKLCKSRDNILSGMAMNDVKFEKYWGYDANQNFILYVANVLDPRFKLKYVQFCFGELYDYHQARDLTTKVKDHLVGLYEFYLRADEVKDVNRHIYDVNDVDCNDTEVNVNTFARFKRHLQKEENVENKNEVERYLNDGCEDPDDEKLDILGWWKEI